MSPHCSAIFLQHSRSADVIAAPGNTQAATGNAASISARAETPILINSFNITSLSTPDSKTQQAGKGFTLPPSRGRSSRSWRRVSIRKDGLEKLALPLGGKMRSVGSGVSPLLLETAAEVSYVFAGRALFHQGGLGDLTFKSTIRHCSGGQCCRQMACLFRRTEPRLFPCAREGKPGANSSQSAVSAVPPQRPFSLLRLMVDQPCSYPLRLPSR